jgi:hypothetical protein
VTGVYSTGANHGFLRTPTGKIVTFDPKGSTSTDTFSINSEGSITGQFDDSAGMVHGFVRNPG